jgi:hypothetical protein
MGRFYPVADALIPAERAARILAQAAALTFSDGLWRGLCQIQDLCPAALSEAAASIELVLAEAEAHIDVAERRP